MPFIIIISILLLSAAVCHTTAKNKGENSVTQGVSGLVLGPLAVIYFLLFK